MAETLKAQDNQPAEEERRCGIRIPPFARFLAMRLLAAIPVLIGVTFICFAILMASPGDPVRVVMGQHYDEEIADRLREEWGLNKPFIVQYGMFLGRVSQGDLGESYIKHTKVAPFLAEKFINTMLLTASAMLLAIVFGMTAGIISAARPRSWLDYLVMLIAVAGISIPVFWLGLMLQLLFATKLGWLPVSGMSAASTPAQIWADAGGNLWLYWWRGWVSHFLLPSITLSTVPMAIIARLTRSSMLEVMNLDYIRTARAKGLSYPRVVMVHGLRNALIPIITVIGNNFALLLTGAVLTETVFNWPGMGTAIYTSILDSDYPIVLGGVMIMALVFVLVNLLVDITYGIIDPRVRYS